MAKVKPFKGVRPPRRMVTEVASRPYDVLNSAEARAEAEGNPKSLYHIIKPEIDFAEGTDERSTTGPWKISMRSSNADGSCRMKKNIIIYMHRPWTAGPSTA